MQNNENKKVLLKISNLKQYFPIGRHGLFNKANDGITLDIFEGETLEDCRIVQTVLRWAEEFNMAIGFGWVRRDVRPVPPATRRMFENHYTIAGPDGQVVSDYSKIHLFQGPRKGHAFRAGDSLSLYKIKGIPSTTFICYDLWFPECISKMADQAHLVIVPANWEEDDYDYSHWKTLLQARAMENQQYVLAVNCVGRNGRFQYGGCSAATLSSHVRRGRFPG